MPGGRAPVWRSAPAAHRSRGRLVLVAAQRFHPPQHVLVYGRLDSQVDRLLKIVERALAAFQHQERLSTRGIGNPQMAIEAHRTRSVFQRLFIVAAAEM